jgi:uncharacterized protein with von Willebrand factor type A (vWA) domain
MRTLAMTLREVKRCTQSGITINTFMLGPNGFFGDFVSRMARLNRGRVFFTQADDLGKYVLVDYITNRKERID